MIISNILHKQKHGFHPYFWEVANMVRNESMERQVALTKITEPECYRIVEYAKDKLNI